MSMPSISIVVPVYNTPPVYLEACINSVFQQTDTSWELVLCDDCSTSYKTIECLEKFRGSDPRIRVVANPKNSGISSATNRAIEFTSGEYVGFLDHDDELEVNAIEEIRKYLQLNPDTDFLYTDEDKIDEFGNICDTYFKPDWSPEHIKSCMYALHFIVVRKRLICKVGLLRSQFDGAQDYDLVLRLSKVSKKIGHISKILYHWRKISGSAAGKVNAKPYAILSQQKALEDAYPASFVEPGLLTGSWRLRPKTPFNELVTVIIPTNGAKRILEGRGEVCLIENCLKSLANNAYKQLKIIVIDDGYLDDSIKSLGKKLFSNIEFYSYDRGVEPFNYSKKINYSWRLADTEYIVFLNDDVEVITQEWVSALGELLNDGVGVVGAKLYHQSNTIQHCGIVLGINGYPAHVYHGYPKEFVGYNAFTHIIRNYSAVTGACMMTRKSLLEEVSGFNEELAVDYNDIDYCLKLKEKNRRIVFTPYAELFHFENSSLERKFPNKNEKNIFDAKWASLMVNDPFHNINLPKDNANYL